MPRRLGLWPGVPVFLAVVLAWFGPAVARHGPGYLHETLVHQHLERYARTWVHAGPWYYYFGEFVAGFLPWSLFVPGALVLAWRTRREAPAARVGTPSAPHLFPLAWFVAGFVFLSLEDETGIANVIVTPQLFARRRLVLVTAPFLLVEGILQMQDGVTSVRARALAPLPALGHAVPSHDFG